MSQSWMADRYHVYLWILDIVIFRPDKFWSQVVVRGNVSGHRWSTYLLKQSMIESGYIIDGASFVLFNSFQADWLQFGWSWAVWRSLWAWLLGGYWEHSAQSWLTRVAVKPLLRSAWRTSASVESTTLRRHISSCAGPGIFAQQGREGTHGVTFFLAGRGCGSAYLGVICRGREWQPLKARNRRCLCECFFFYRFQPGKLIRTGAFKSHKARS